MHANDSVVLCFSLLRDISPQKHERSLVTRTVKKEVLFRSGYTRFASGSRAVSCMLIKKTFFRAHISNALPKLLYLQTPSAEADPA